MRGEFTPRLFDPIKAGTLELRNRIVMPPMATEFSTAQGAVTDKQVFHYAERAQEIGLMIVEHTYVAPEGRLSKNQLGVYSDKLVPGLKKIVDVVHLQETPIALQITHAGGVTTREMIGALPSGPSPVPNPLTGEVPGELSKEDIDEIVRSFANAAQRAAEAGFDAVEIHGAHGYLLNQFLSPLTNKRTDEYGGPLENRVRLPLRIIGSIRKELGRDYLLLYRLGVDDFLAGGLTLEEGVRASRTLEEAGIDIIDVSSGFGDPSPSERNAPGYLVRLAAGVKRAVRVPVIGVGGITTAQEADAIIKSGDADLVAVGRAILKDPKWAFKAMRSLKGLYSP